MLKANPPRYERRNVTFFLSALVVAVVDQLSKTGIRFALATGESLFEFGFFRITRIHNTGAAFGLFQDQSFFLAIFALVGVVFLLLFGLLFARRFAFLDSRLGKLALGLVLGGTAGNLVDRLRLGYVIDFIDIGIWPAFNFADSAIVVGSIVLAYFFLTGPKDTGV